MMVGMWGGEDIESLVLKGLTTHRPKADIGGVNLSKAFLFTKRICGFCDICVSNQKYLFN